MNQIKTLYKSFSNCNLIHYIKLSMIPLFCYFSFVIWLNPYKTASLEEKYTDHIRHTYTSYGFWQVGLELYTEPLMNVAPKIKAERPQVLWQGLPLFYPIGQVLLFSPFGYLNNSTCIDESFIYKLEIFIFLIISFFFVYFFICRLNSLGISNFYILLFFIFFVNWILRWTLNGTYDIIALYLLCIAIVYFNEKKYHYVVFFFSLAFFLHYRIIVYAPILLISFFFCLKNNQRKIFTLGRSVLGLLSILMLCSSIYTLYLCYPLQKLIPFDEAWVYYKDLNPRFFVLIGTVVILSVYFAYKKEYLYMIQFACVSLFFSALVQMKYHHSFVLFPLLLMNSQIFDKDKLLKNLILISPYIIFWILFKENPKLDIWVYSFKILFG